MAKQQNTLALFPHFRLSEAYYEDTKRAIIIEMSLVLVNGQEIRNPTNDRQLEDLQLRAYLYPEDRYPEVGLGYRRYFAKVADCKAMAKYLDKVLKKYHKMTDEMGECTDTFQSIGRFCAAMGIKHIIRQVTNNGSMYSDNEHRFLDVNIGLRYLKTTVAEMQETNHITTS